MSETMERLIRCGHTLIAIESIDEDRALKLVSSVAAEMDRPLFEWSMTTGLCRRTGRGLDDPLVKPDKLVPALQQIQKGIEPAIYVLKDIGPHCKDALVYRILRDLTASLPQSDSAIVLVDALPLPDEVRRFTVRYELGWPTPDELEQAIRRTFQRIQTEGPFKLNSRVSRRDLDQLIQALRGLSCGEAERVVSAAILDDYALSADDLPTIVEGKRTLLGSAGCLEAIAADVNPAGIGGLARLKKWLSDRRSGYTREAREFGLEAPRGVLMLGVPGCGKSLCAKVVASDWGMPLLRLDPGVLYQKFIGESESQLRQALAQAEAMSPAVLWIDEIEKAFASASDSMADGGLSKRMFGTLLSWMQDHRHPIFIIATANDVSTLPPELMRKGRFDEVFFIDLPAPEVRAQILGIHLSKRKRDPKKFNVQKLAEASQGFSGAELEQAVISALFAAFNVGKELSDGHLLEAIRQTQPLSVLMGERVASLRDWARDRCVPAD